MSKGFNVNFDFFHLVVPKKIFFLHVYMKPLRIRVRIDPPHPHGVVLRMRPEKPRLHVSADVAR
jgi:hypothetical protein